MMGVISVLGRLAARNIKIFMRDRANIFFSLLSPLIVLALYVFFIGRMQADEIKSLLDGLGVSDDGTVSAFCDSWMISGVMATSCITVPLCACGIMIQDKIRGISADFLSSPVPAWVPYAAYFISVVATGLIICLIVLCVCFLWLASTGGWLLSAADVFGCIGVLVLSVLSSSTLLVFIISFFSSEGAFTGVNVIIGTVTGFLIGAYIPVSIFPEAVQYATLFVPGSYSASLFRNFFMNGAVEKLADAVSPAFAAELADSYAVHLNFFGHSLSSAAAAGILAGTVVLFGACCFVCSFIRVKNNKI